MWQLERAGRRRDIAVGWSGRGWLALPASPLNPRSDAHAFWTGERVILVGGSDARPCPLGADGALPAEPPLTDGATFDPSSGTWQSIAKAPLPLGQLSGVVIVDTLYVRLAGQPGEGSAFLSYGVRDDRWTELEQPREAQGGSWLLVAAGDRLVAYSPSQEHGVLPTSCMTPRPVNGPTSRPTP